MSNQVEEQLSSLKKQMNVAQERKLRATVESEQAENRRDESLKLLKEKFKAQTVDEAVALMSKMEKGMLTKIAEATTALEQASDE